MGPMSTMTLPATGTHPHTRTHAHGTPLDQAPHQKQEQVSTASRMDYQTLLYAVAKELATRPCKQARA